MNSMIDILKVYGMKINGYIYFRITSQRPLVLVANSKLNLITRIRCREAILAIFLILFQFTNICALNATIYARCGAQIHHEDYIYILYAIVWVGVGF